VPGISTEDLHKLEEEVRSTHLRDSLLEALRWGRLYGGAAAIIMISGQEEDLSLPIDINNIMPGSFRGLYVVDRWSGIYPSLTLVDNERDPDFGLPDYYEVRDETGSGTYRVHHSRVLRFCGTKMPYWEEVAEQYWGTSAIEAHYDELIKRDNVAHNIANLTFKANLSVLQVENLDQMFATSSSVHQRRMYAMLSAINTMENSLGIRLVNKGDDIQQLQYSFSGLPEVMDSAMMDMAGATSIPVTRLFGRSPAGMNSTGESDEKMYRQTLEQERAVHITPVLERLIPIVCHSAIGCFPAGATFKYPSLIEIAPQEKASIIDQQIQPLERLFQSNLLSGDKVLEALRNAQTSLDITPVITDDDIARVKGKYYNDLQNNADPYGGAMQTANEAGIESGAEQVDENGNPIEQPQVDENGNPIEQQQEATPEQQAEAVK
jgi:phage-related protein (TIGR01555 family)